MDACPDTAAAQGVRAMPTFIFYRNKNKIDSMQVSVMKRGQPVIGKGLNILVVVGACPAFLDASEFKAWHCLNNVVRK